ncbi:MAG: acyl-ACP thioesterase domain-containing protein [Calditrichia bacterium]
MMVHFEKEFEVYPHEVDFRGDLKLTGLINYFQSAAGEHAAILGVSVQDLFRRNRTWVLSRNHIVLYNRAGMGEKLRLKTWPSGLMTRYALRDYQFFNQQNQLIAAGTTSWMVVDLNKRRPVQFDKEFASFPRDPERALADDFSALPEHTIPGEKLNFRVRLHDLDINHHVNNVSYLEWAMESLPQDFLISHKIKELEVSYRAEIFMGETVESACLPLEEGLWHHQLYRASDQKEIARLRTKWESYSG